MTEIRKPPRCHYDRALHERVITDHRETCPHELGTGDCPAAGRGCAPCTAPHCLVCGREHVTNDQPDTCTECIGKIHADLTDLAQDYAALAVEAISAGHDGRLVAAAPIPGGTAAVLHGPSVRLDQLRISATTAKDHAIKKSGKSADPIPPLAALAHWEDLYRAWFDHTRGDTAKADAYAWYGGNQGQRPPSRASVAGAVRYLTEQLDHIANGPAVHEGPDFLAFAKSIRNLRAGIERALHDEQEPERGVECFECGDQLVRRFRDPKWCRHKTPARAELERHLIRQARAQDWLRLLRTYPELDVMEADLAAARGPSASLLAAARQPCAKCQAKFKGGQGGLDDPRAGRAWECPGCRKHYDVGEYATAVKRDLLENGDQGNGWIHVRAAADAATDVIGMVVTDTLVRKWLDRGKIGGLCEWTPGRPWGLRLVYWPDVAAEAIDAVARMQADAEKRRAKAELEGTWRRDVLAAVAKGGRVKVAGKRVAERLAIHPARLPALVEDLESEVAWRLAVGRGEDPVKAGKRLGISKARLSELLDTVAA